MIPLMLAVGTITGLLVRPSLERVLGRVATVPEDDHHSHDVHADEHDEHDEHEEDHLPLSFEAVQNLNLRVKPVTLSDFTEFRRMPGEIIEYAGLSSRKVAAPVSGKVVRLFASPGVSIAPGEALLEFEIIDDELMAAQLRLLELLTDQQIAAEELQRLTPLAESGGIAGKKKIELEYRKRELAASLSRTRQELAMRGLSAEQIAAIQRTGKAITNLTVVAPPIGSPGDADGGATLVKDPVSSGETLAASQSIEDLYVEVGQNVSRGEAVGSLAVHGLLMVCGHAFESDMELVTHVASDDIPVALEFGTSQRATVEHGFRIQNTAGHVDETTQTFRFFIPIENEVVRESQDSLGRTYRTWRYKVGQRVHVLIPTERLSDQIVLPREAVVQVGLEHFAFREITNDHAAANESIYMEMEPVPVRIETRNKESYVISPGGQLKVGDRVAVNAAYKMHLALKSQQEGGGLHDHGHSH